MNNLSPGANAALPSGSQLRVEVSTAGSGADLVCLLLDENSRAEEEAVVLYSNPTVYDGAASLEVNSLIVDLSRLPAKIERLLICAQADGTPNLSSAGEVVAKIQMGQELIQFGVESQMPTLQLVEIYKRGDAWKVRALGDGYSDGLEKLLTVHGISVSDDEEVQAEAVQEAPASMKKDAPVPSGISFEKVSGSVDLRKGDTPILMEKTALITATASWPAATDYDLYALVMLKDGRQIDIAAFPADGVPIQMEYAGIRHTGDVRRSSGAQIATEVLEIKLSSEVLAVVPVAYSAQSNGTGSFRKYQVSLAIDNGQGTKVTIPAENANKSSIIFTCVPGIIMNLDQGVVIEPLEYYSKRFSEKRPRLVLDQGRVRVEMDAGPINKYK